MFGLGLDAVEEATVQDIAEASPADVRAAIKAHEKEEREKKHLMLQTLMTLAVIGTFIFTLYKFKKGK